MSSAKDDYIQYRIERAWESLEEAKLLFEHEHYNTAFNRIYYACFYIVFALLLKSDFSMHTHAGVKSLFNQHFAAPQRIDKETARFYNDMFQKRQKGDYDEFPNFSEEEVELLIKKGEDFLSVIEAIIRS